MIISRLLFCRKFISRISFGSLHNTETKVCNAIFSQKYSNDADTSMKSAAIKKLNEPLIIEESTKKVPLKKGQIRIAVHYCSVNSYDHLLWTGQSETKVRLPLVPGFEVSGEVLQIGPPAEGGNDNGSDDEDELRVGDRVLALNKEILNGFATECVAEKRDVFQIPASVSYETAAALADSYGTALLGLSRRAKLQQGETVLITAAAGGLGLAAVDIAANIYKAKVIGVCGTEDKATLVRDKGAWAAFTFKTDKMLKSEVKKISNGEGANVVFEAVGGEIFKSALECVAPEGKVIIAGFTSRDVPQLPMNDILTLPSFSLIGVSLSNYRNKMLPVYRRSILDVIEMCEQGLISPTISQIFPLESVNEALVSLTEKKTTAIILRCSADRFPYAGILPDWVKKEYKRVFSNNEYYDEETIRIYWLELDYITITIDEEENKVWNLNGKSVPDLKKICLEEADQFFIRTTPCGCSSIHDEPNKVSDPKIFPNLPIIFNRLKKNYMRLKAGDEESELHDPLKGNTVCCQVERVKRNVNVDPDTGDVLVISESLQKINFLLVRTTHPKNEFTTFLLDTDDAEMDNNNTVVKVQSGFIVHNREGKEL